MSVVSVRAVGTIVAIKLLTVLALFSLFTLGTLAGFTFIRALDPSDIFSSSLKIILLPLNFILSVLVYKNLGTIIAYLVRILIYKDFDLLKLFFRNLGIVF